MKRFYLATAAFFLLCAGIAFGGYDAMYYRIKGALENGLATSQTARQYGIQANRCRDNLYTQRWIPLRNRTSKNRNLRDAAYRQMGNYVRECWNRYASAIETYRRAIDYFNQAIQLENQRKVRMGNTGMGDRARREINNARNQIQMLQNAAENMRKYWAGYGVMF